MNAADSSVCAALEGTQRHVLVKVKMSAMSLVHDQQYITWCTDFSNPLVIGD
jgi:hypothetical protein